GRIRIAVGRRAVGRRAGAFARHIRLLVFLSLGERRRSIGARAGGDRLGRHRRGVARRGLVLTGPPTAAPAATSPAALFLCLLALRAGSGTRRLRLGLRLLDGLVVVVLDRRRQRHHGRDHLRRLGRRQGTQTLEAEGRRDQAVVARHGDAEPI